MRATVKSNIKDLIPLVPFPSEDELRLLAGNYFMRAVTDIDVSHPDKVKTDMPLRNYEI